MWGTSNSCATGIPERPLQCPRQQGHGGKPRLSAVSTRLEHSIASASPTNPPSTPRHGAQPGLLAPAANRSYQSPAGAFAAAVWQCPKCSDWQANSRSGEHSAATAAAQGQENHGRGLLRVRCWSHVKCSCLCACGLPRPHESTADVGARFVARLCLQTSVRGRRRTDRVCSISPGLESGPGLASLRP